MPRYVRFEGRVLSFPDDATDDEIGAALTAMAPAPTAPTEPEGPGLINRGIPLALRMGGAITGSVLGAGAGAVAGGVGAVPGEIVGSAIGSGAGETLAQGYERLTGQRDSFNLGQIAVQTGLGAIPMGPLAKYTGRSLMAIRGAQGAGMGALSTAATEYADTGQLPSGGQIARGAGLGLLLGAGGGKLEGVLRARSAAAAAERAAAADAARGIRPSAVGRAIVESDPRMVSTLRTLQEAPAPRPRPAGLLPAAGERFAAQADPAMTEALRPLSGSLQSPRPAYRAPSEPLRLTAPRAITVTPDGVAVPPGMEVPRPTAPAPRPPGPDVPAARPATVSEWDVDPLRPVRDGGLTPRAYASDPNAVASYVTPAERQMLERMQADLETFSYERGGLVYDEPGARPDPFTNRPDLPGGGHYVPAVAGTPVADDIRTLADSNVSQKDILAAVNQLLEGRAPTNKTHLAVIDAARGYLEQRPGYRGPMLPSDLVPTTTVEDPIQRMRQSLAQPESVPPPRVGTAIDAMDPGFRAFSEDVDALAGSVDDGSRMAGEEGFVDPRFLMRVGGGAAGAAYGYATGDTPQERLENALLFGAAGLAAPSLLAREGGSPPTKPSTPKVPGVMQEAPSARLRNPTAASARAMGTAMSDPMAKTAGFLDKVSGGNPLLRTGLEERLAANGGFETQRRGVLNVEATGRLAQEIGVDLSKATKRGTAFNAETVAAYARAVHTTSETVSRLSKVVASGQATDADVIKLAAAEADANTVMQSLMGARSEAGRALSMFRSLSAVLATGDVNLYRSTADQLRGEAAQLAQEVSQISDPIAKYRFLQSRQAVSLGDKFRSYFFANILSGVKTQERNILGNASSAALRLAATPTTAAADAIQSARTGAPRTAYVGELQPAMVGTLAGLERGFKNMVFTLRHGVQPETLQSGIDAATTRGVLEVPRVEFGGGGANPFNWPGRGLDAMDALFRAAVHDGEAYAAAWSKAKAEGLSGQQLIDRAAALRTDEAIQQGARTTATDALFQRKLTGAMAGLQGVAKDWFFVLPFVRTPTNIVRKSVQMSPAGFLLKDARQGGRAGAQAQGLAALGTLAAAPLAYLAATGRLSGTGPRDPAERSRLREEGWAPNSIKIGDAWVDYSLMQPLSGVASMIANGFEAWREDGAKPQEAATFAAQVGLRSARSLLDQSFLSGLYDVLSVVENPSAAGVNSALGRLAHSLTPLAGAQRTVTQMLDPTVRDPQSMGDMIRSNVPGLSQTVPPLLTRFGEDVTRPMGRLSAVEPMNLTPVRPDPVSTELARVGVRVGRPTDRMALPPGIVLTPEQSLALRRAKGQAVREAVEGTMSAPGYQGLSPERQARALTRARTRANTRINRLERNAQRGR